MFISAFVQGLPGICSRLNDRADMGRSVLRPYKIPARRGAT